MTTLAHRGLRPAAELSAASPHGDRLRYIAGCRCHECRAANARYESARQRARRSGDWNGIVPADRARSHLVKLSKAGIGRRAVAAASDVALTVLLDVRTGRKRRIRARTERLILAVGKPQMSDHAVVDARRTHRLIAELLTEGYTMAFLAARLGYRHPALQFGERITVRNAARVERLHRELTT